MERQALYVVTDMGRDRFIWATSAAEARKKAANRNHIESPSGKLASLSSPNDRARSVTHHAGNIRLAQ